MQQEAKHASLDEPGRRHDQKLGRRALFQVIHARTLTRKGDSYEEAGTRALCTSGAVRRLCLAIVSRAILDLLNARHDRKESCRLARRVSTDNALLFGISMD